MKTFGIILSVIGGVAAGLGIIGIIKKPGSVYKNSPTEKNPMEGKKVRFVEVPSEPANADGVCGHLEAVGESEHKAHHRLVQVPYGLDARVHLRGVHKVL